MLAGGLVAAIEHVIRSAQNVLASGRNVRSERSPLHDVRQHAHGGRPVDGTFRKTRICFRTSRVARARTKIIQWLIDGIAAGGARRDRTDDLLLAKQALSQLSYGPAPTDGLPTEARGY